MRNTIIEVARYLELNGLSQPILVPRYDGANISIWPNIKMSMYFYCLWW